MESFPNIKWAWKEGFQFAFASEFRPRDGGIFFYEMNIAERCGSLFLKPIYKTLKQISRYIRKPLAICAFTIFAAFLSLLVFYDFPVLVILGKMIPYQTVRYLLFLYIECTFFCLGCRALGRFNNKALVDCWKSNELTPIFLEDNL